MMRKRINLFVLFACCLCALSCSTRQLASETSTKETTIKIMSYNIHHANPPSKAGVIDLDAIAGVINKEGPDLVAVQEVDVHTGRSGKDVSQAEVLAEKTGMKAYFAKAIDHDGGDYGVLILSRFPLSNAQTHRLPTASGTGGEPRVLATAEVAVNGRKLLFACTHLDAQRADTNRFLQINALAEILKEQKLPVVIGGDLNAEAGGKIINVLDRHFDRSCKTDCGFTIPSDLPKKTIDFIAYTPGAFDVSEHKVVNEPYASDHLPVTATLRFR